MKQSELKKCALCHNGVLHEKHTMNFYRVRIESFVANFPAIQRQVGLEIHMQSQVLAWVMGTDEDVALKCDECEVLLCLSCAMRGSILEILESGSARESLQNMKSENDE